MHCDVISFRERHQCFRVLNNCVVIRKIRSDSRNSLYQNTEHWWVYNKIFLLVQPCIRSDVVLRITYQLLDCSWPTNFDCRLFRLPDLAIILTVDVTGREKCLLLLQTLSYLWYIQGFVLTNSLVRIFYRYHDIDRYLIVVTSLYTFSRVSPYYLHKR
jgi:hypothetical protein